MRPLDNGKDWALDYTSSQTIKLYNKATEAVKGDTFDGKYLYSWLARVHDKARTYSWLPVLTINGKALTKSYAEITMDEVRKHAQLYQNEARRSAQNSEQLLLCLQASISRPVYNRVNQLTKMKQGEVQKNSEKLLLCLQASISRPVYNRVHQLEEKYTITRKPEKEDVWDGVCYLKY
jgi:hypothetical protein